jgi:hypothetical protein
MELWSIHVALQYPLHSSFYFQLWRRGEQRPTKQKYEAWNSLCLLVVLLLLSPQWVWKPWSKCPPHSLCLSLSLSCPIKYRWCAAHVEIPAAFTRSYLNICCAYLNFASVSTYLSAAGIVSLHFMLLLQTLLLGMHSYCSPPTTHNKC